MKRIFVLWGLLALVLCGGAFCWAEGDNEPLSRLGAVRIAETSGDAVLRIESDAAKTQVYLNGVYHGKSNLTVDGLLPGEYVVTLSKPGYKTVSYLIEARKNYKLTYRIKMESLVYYDDSAGYVDFD